jgi:RNA polymerase sigma-70 factor (ECF subfamily)
VNALSNRSEDELLAAAQAGDRLAFEAAISPHLAMLLAYSRAICGDFHAAEDVVQETALIAFRQLHRLFPEVDFATWLRGIAKRQALAARRRLAKLVLIDEALELAYADAAPAEDRDTERKALASCLSRLGPRVGRIVEQHYREGLALAEVASELNMSVGAVKVAMYRARMQLKDCVQALLRRKGDE